MTLPDRVLAWYGDDFTGSTDVLEVLARAGLEPVLFLEPPRPEDLERFAQARAVGLAGVSRARDPLWMNRHLPALFGSLAQMGAPLLHYKVCSTFDSSPSIGSIGRALEIGRRAVGARGATPVVVGAPALKRFTAFGHLFATAQGTTWRIDRHPTMSRHPVTPMNESDLALHLAAQTALPVSVFDLVALDSPDCAPRYAAALRQDGALLIDVLDETSLERAGSLVWRHAADAPFCVGSSGLEYALVAHWRRAGLLDPAPPERAADPVDRLITVSGSCSPGTGEQILAAERAGHATIRLDAARLPAGNGDANAEVRRVRAAAARALDDGRSVVVFTAVGPQDPAIDAMRQAASARGDDPVQAAMRIGQVLGALLRDLAHEYRPRRVAVAGGDTSGEVATALQLRALTMVASLAPGSPLCRTHADDAAFDGLEIVLKGGQVGGPDFFEEVRRGGISAHNGAATRNSGAGR